MLDEEDGCIALVVEETRKDRHNVLDERAPMQFTEIGIFFYNWEQRQFIGCSGH